MNSPSYNMHIRISHMINLNISLHNDNDNQLLSRPGIHTTDKRM